MSNLQSLYNALPSIQVTHDSFEKGKSKSLLSKLIPLISKYNNRFGVCLIHAHTTLEPGEVMLSNKNGIAKPIHEPTTKYAEWWLISGEPYEFSTAPPAATPPPEFFWEFRDITGDNSYLGIFAVNPDAPDVQTETNNGRRSITKPGPPVEQEGTVYVESAWVPSLPNVFFFCISVCVGC